LSKNGHLGVGEGRKIIGSVVGQHGPKIGDKMLGGEIEKEWCGSGAGQRELFVVG